MNRFEESYKCDSSPQIISFDVTGSCNYKCLHCYNDCGKKLTNELTNEEVIDIALQIRDMKPFSVCLCGGEPTLRSNYIDVIKILAETAGNVNMVSNGSFIDYQVACELKAAGLKTLQISLDGYCSMQHDTLRSVKGAFDKALNAIRGSVEAGLNVATSCTPSKLNYKTIKQYIALCEDLGVNSARFMPLIPMGRGSRIDFLLLSPLEYMELQMDILSAQREQKKNTSSFYVEWGDPLDHYTRMPTNAKLGMCSYTMEIKANGNLTVSTYLPIVIGNVRKHSLQEYWDAGAKHIWSNKKVTDYISRIENIYDINQLEPRPYTGDYYYIDII